MDFSTKILLFGIFPGFLKQIFKKFWVYAKYVYAWLVEVEKYFRWFLNKSFDENLVLQLPVTGYQQVIVVLKSFINVIGILSQEFANQMQFFMNIITMWSQNGRFQMQ